MVASRSSSSTSCRRSKGWSSRSAGAGLAGGVASALKALKPAVRIVAVQSDGYPSMPESLAAGAPVSLQPHTIADGTTAPVDPANLALLREVIDEWVIVPEVRLKPKIGELAARAKIVAEGAGVLAYASLEQLEPGPVTVAVVSGGNLSPALLAECLALFPLPASGEG